MVYVSLADMALHGGSRKRYDSFSPSLWCLYPSYGNFTPSSVLWGHPTAYDAFATLLSLLGIPQITLFRGHRRLSPVDIDSIVRYEQVSDTAVPANHSPYRCSPCCLPRTKPRRHTVWVFRCSILSLPPHFPRFTFSIAAACTEFATGDVAFVFPGRVSTGYLSHPFTGRT